MISNNGMRDNLVRFLPGIGALACFLMLLGIAGTVYGWTGPTDSPPDGNVSAPINVGSTAQTKDGTLGVDGLAVFGNTLLSGSDRYLNWGSSAGSDGYGIRDSSGTLEFKNSGGSWTSMSTAIGNYLTLNGLTLSSGDGTFTGTVSADSFLYSSDARLKESVRPLVSSLETLMRFNPVSYIWKSGPRVGEADTGFLAQDVEVILPKAVHTDAEGMKSVDYIRIVPLLVGALQEQQKEIEALKVRVTELEK